MNEDALQIYLPELVEITDEVISDYMERDQLSDLILELYREAGVVCVLCGNAYDAERNPKGALDRNQAICAGLLVRMTKFMVAVNLLTTDIERSEVIIALGRSIMESAANLRFLIAQDDDELYEKFVKASLGTERAFYDLVIRNIADRGSTLQIEEDIIKSIRRLAEVSGVEIENVDSRFTDWAGSLRQRYERIGESGRYVTEQRMGSHAVHGTWSDLVLHHLQPVDDGFVVNPEWTVSDGQLLSPIALIVLEAARIYVAEFFEGILDLQPLVERIDDLMQRILKVELARDDWLSTPGTDGGSS